MEQLIKILISHSIMAVNCSNGVCLGQANGQIKVHVQHDGFGTWSCHYYANLWIFHLLVRMGKCLLPDW